MLPRHVHRTQVVPRTSASHRAARSRRSSPGSCSDWTCTWHTVSRAVITRRTDANSESSPMKAGTVDGCTVAMVVGQAQRLHRSARVDGALEHRRPERP